MDHVSNHSQDWQSWLEANAARYLLFARSQARCEADAQDLLQEALVEGWQRAHGRPPDDALVYRTIRRRAIDLGRRTDRRERREQADPDRWAQPEEETSREAELEEAVKALPTHLQEVITLKIWGGLTFREIAEALDLPPGTVASRYRYALDHLRQSLKEVAS